jgi:hypothetical protein
MHKSNETESINKLTGLGGRNLQPRTLQWDVVTQCAFPCAAIDTSPANQGVCLALISSVELKLIEQAGMLYSGS